MTSPLPASPYEIARGSLGACAKVPACDHIGCVMPRELLRVAPIVEAAEAQSVARFEVKSMPDESTEEYIRWYEARSQWSRACDATEAAIRAARSAQL